MYTLYADGVVLFQSDISDSEYFLGKPEEKLDLGKVGSVRFTIYPSHPEYENIKAMITRIKVTKDDGKIVFIGRVLDVTKGTWNEKQCVCEDALGFLNDGFIPKMEKRSDITPHQFFASCIAAHNNSTSPDKHLIVGELRLDEGEVQKEFEIQSYSRVKNIIDSNLINMYGGYLHLRYDDNDDTKIYVDYLQKFDQMGSQVIEFAKNLIELEDKMEGADVFTAMIATGKDHITIGDAVTSGTQNIGRDIIIQTVAGDPIIRIPEAIAKYGWIYRIEQFSSKETAADVLKEAKKYILNNYRKIPNTLSLKVVDMHLLNGSIDDIWIGKKYRIVSNPHGVDVILLCIGINIDIQNPENTTYEFGDPTLQTSEATSNGSTSSSSGGGSSSLSGSTAGIGQACLWDGEDIDISKHEIILRAEENMLLEAKTMELKADLLVTDTNMAQVWTNSFLVMGGRLSQGGDGAYYDDQGRLIIDADGKFAAGVDEAKYLVLKQAYELLHHVNPETGEEEPITFSALTTDVNLIGKNLTQAQMDILTNAEGIAGNRTMIDGHEATLTAINTDITNITSRVTTIGGDLDAAEIAIAQHGESITSIKSDVTVLGSGLTQAQADIITANTRIGEHEATLTAINTDITNITSRVTTIGGDLDADEILIASQGQSITSIKSDITNINGKITNINSSITNINSDIVNIKGDLTAASISSRLATLDSIHFKNIVADSGGYVMAPAIYLGTLGNASNLVNAVKYVFISLSGDTYTLKTQNFNGEDTVVGTFSRATKLTCGWSSGKFTVNAKPQNESIATTIVQGITTWNGTVATVPIRAYDSDNPNYEYNTGREITVDMLNAFKLVTITLQGDQQTCFVEAASGGYDYYKAGTKGTYYKGNGGDFTVQGDSQACFIEATSGGYNYYKAGTAVTRYKASSTKKTARGDSVSVTPIGDSVSVTPIGDSVSVTPIGDSVSVTPIDSGSKKHLLSTTRYKAGTTKKTAIGNAQYFIRHNKSDTVNTTYWYELTNSKPSSNKTYITRYFEGSQFTVQGDSQTCFIEASSGGYNYYKAGTAATYYKKGTAATYYKKGTAATYYKKGTEVTYYKGNGGEFTVQGDSESITPIDTSTKKHLLATTRYKAGTTTKTARGDSVEITPIDASTKKHLLSTIRYKAGTPNSTSYYTKK